MRVLALLLLMAGLVVPFVGFVGAVVAWYRKQRGWAIFAMVVGIVASQFSLVPYLVGLDNLFPSLYYESTDGGFRGTECFKSQVCSWESLQLDLAHYRMLHGNRGIELRRTFQADAWRFWRWFEYLSEPRWRLPYVPARYCREGANSACDPGPPPHHRPPARTEQEQEEQARLLSGWRQ